MWAKRKLFILIAFLIPLFCYSEEEDHSNFNTVDYIFNHVNDAHEWHFISLGDKHITLPLPIIIYSKQSGWHFFSSSKFHHPSKDFTFEIAQEEPNKGKIIERNANNEISVPLDLSITKTVVGIFIVSILMVWFIIRSARKTAKNNLYPPHGVQNIVELLTIFIRDDVAKQYVGRKYYNYLPYLLTIFIFILCANLIGLILPLGINITGNIAVTLVLATFTFIVTTFSGNKQYWGHIFNPTVPWFMKLPIPIVPFIEFAGIFIKPIVLMVRLFANMFASHMIVTVLVALIFLMSSIFNPIIGFGTSIIAIIFSVFMMIIDILVSFIQAYIFTLLSAMYFGMATAEGEH